MLTKSVVFRSLSVFLFLVVTFFLCSQILSTQASAQKMWYEEELEAMPDWIPGAYEPFLSRYAGWGFWYEEELEAIPNWLPGIWMPGRMIYSVPAMGYSRKNSANGYDLFFSFPSIMNAAPEPTSLTFNGRGIDLNEDKKVDSLGGYFYGTECTDTCEEVIGDFDAYTECTDTCDEVIGDFDAYTECTDTCDDVVGDFDAYTECTDTCDEVVGDFDAYI